jgi:hypothetical protein
MSSQIVIPEWLKVLLPVGVAVVSTVATLGVSWAKDLNSSARRIRLFDEAAKRTAFWDSWAKAISATSCDPDIGQTNRKVHSELTTILSIVEAVPSLRHVDKQQARREHRVRIRSLSPLRRILLLYSPPDPWGWAFHFLFYYALLLPVLVRVFPLETIALHLPGHHATNANDHAGALATSISPMHSWLNYVLMVLVYRAIAEWQDRHGL